jgi:hypothetical protein
LAVCRLLPRGSLTKSKDFLWPEPISAKVVVFRRKMMKAVTKKVGLKKIKELRKKALAAKEEKEREEKRRLRKESKQRSKQRRPEERRLLQMVCLPPSKKMCSILRHTGGGLTRGRRPPTPARL